MPQRVSRLRFADDDFESINRQTASLAGLAVALFLVVVGLYLIQALHEKTRVEDCLLAGRLNCDSLVATISGNSRRAVR